MACTALVAGGALVAAGTPAAASPQPPKAGHWGPARPVPGTDKLTPSGHNPLIADVSCSAPGECAAIGRYRDASEQTQSFLVEEKHGVWGEAHGIPGVAGLKSSGIVDFTHVSCPSPGNCTAVGTYADAVGVVQIAVVEEKRGNWSSAEPLAAVAALSPGHNLSVRALSCSSAGNCAAGGGFMDKADALQAYVIEEENGVWQRALPVPDSDKLNVRGDGQLLAVSCPEKKNCTATGSYADGSNFLQVWVADETDGTWGRAISLPMLADINTGNAELGGLSCGSPGTCVVGGSFLDGTGKTQAFVADEVNGRWGKAASCGMRPSLTPAGTRRSALSRARPPGTAPLSAAMSLDPP